MALRAAGGRAEERRNTGDGDDIRTALPRVPVAAGAPKPAHTWGSGRPVDPFLREPIDEAPIREPRITEAPEAGKKNPTTEDPRNLDSKDIPPKPKHNPVINKEKKNKK